MLGEELIPRLPAGEWGDEALMWLRDNLDPLFKAFSKAMSFMVEGFSEFLVNIPALILAIILALLAIVFRSFKFGIGTFISLLAVMAMREWEPMLQTMSLVLVATLVAVIIAIPVGIWAAKSKTVSAIVRPILDFMQTMPAFVYLIPAVMFFSIGVVPGIFSTIIFAMPPGVRMTELGIRQVNKETVEAGKSYGATNGQILKGIQLPLAIPTIMAGVNQVIMLSLSMAVIAGMVGADGLGKQVVSAISTLDLALGIEAGLSVVILAVFLDRLTAALGTPSQYPGSLVALLRSSGRAKSKAKPKNS